MYQVIDRQTGKVVATKRDRVAARRIADRKDLAYGAIRYLVKFVENNS